MIAALMLTLLLSSTLSARAEPLSAERRGTTTIFEDSMGRDVGRAERRGNTTTFEDRTGRDVGRAEHRKDGAAIFYNEKGQRTGTARTR
jgi:hypothetical protein